MREVEASADLLACPVAFRGSVSECAEYARANGFNWRRKRAALCGGYYVAENGDSLLPS
jgi:hypothetical protein